MPQARVPALLADTLDSALPQPHSKLRAMLLLPAPSLGTQMWSSTHTRPKARQDLAAYRRDGGTAARATESAANQVRCWDAGSKTFPLSWGHLAGASKERARVEKRGGSSCMLLK